MHFWLSKTVVLLWFSVAFLFVRVSVRFHLICVHILLVRYLSMSVDEWLPSGTSCPLCWQFDYLSFSLFPNDFEGCISDLIALVHGRCMRFTFLRFFSYI